MVRAIAGHAGSLALPAQPPLTLTFVGSEKKGPLA